jgi:hypothetical protein
MSSQRYFSKNSLFAILVLIPFLSHSELPYSKVDLQFGENVRVQQVNAKGYKFEWGKNDIRNISELSFDSAEIHHSMIATESDDFVVLKNDVDTGTRRSIILPLNMKSTEIIYENAICIDLENQTIISEVCSQDTVLIIENFINKKKMVLGKNFIPCETGFAHDCLDSLIFYDKRLSFKWITPFKNSVSKNIEMKRYKVRLK